MGDIHNTQFFKAVQENKMDVGQVLEQVWHQIQLAVNQLVLLWYKMGA